MSTSSILDLIYFNCSNNPGLTAIDYEGSTITYEELRQELEHSSEKLDLAGIRRAQSCLSRCRQICFYHAVACMLAYGSRSDPI